MLLARLSKITTDPIVLDALTQENATSVTGALLQDHYTVEGSHEERVAAVGCAFRCWLSKRQEETGSESYYYWNTMVLAVYDTYLIFYVPSYGKGPEYYRVNYTMDNGKPVLDTEIKEISIKMVVEEVSMQEEAAETAEAQEAKKTPMSTKQKQDQVTDEVVVETSKPVSHSGDEPAVTTSETDADESGASMPDPSADAASGKPVSHSGDEGVGGGPADEGASEVKSEMAETESGYKGENPADPGKNVSVMQNKYLGKSEYFLQSVGKDQGDNSFCQILKQTISEDGTKLLQVEGIATRADIVSAAGFVYPLSVWEQNLERMNTEAKAGKFIGKLEHPDQEQGLLDTAIKYNEFWIQGADVLFKGTVLSTDAGEELQALIEGGVQIDMSSRGYGTAKKQSWRGQDVMLIQDGFVCTGFDAVLHGASVGSTITEAKRQSIAANSEESEIKVETKEKPIQQQDVKAKAEALRQSVEITQTRNAMLAQAGLTDLGLKAYRQALDKCEDIEALVETSEAILPVLQSTFAKAEEDASKPQAETWSPTFMVKQSAEELAPQTVGEMIDRLVADLPDVPVGSEAHGQFPHKLNSMQKQCRFVLQNIARTVTPEFNGHAAALGLLALEQGKVDRAKDILEQSLATGATTAAANAESGGAPLSAPLIFPLVRRVYPRYIMNEIASIQPMDRPEGKIFYLDTYRTEDPAGFEKRMDLNTSANPFNSSYADNANEGAAAMLIRLRLASVTVDAHTKKLGAAWSIEEMQDLRAYHGLDAAQELMGGVAREMALEWNLEVLNDMLTQATAASLTYGTAAPASGFPNQIDWDAYIWNYIQKLDNAIFSKRNGPMTHIVAGVDAALALAKSGRMTFGIGGDNGGDMPEQFPGAVFFGIVNAPNGSRYKVFKTNFWGTGTANGSKILGLRKGGEWSDTPYIWAPYCDYVTPVLTDPADFSQKQGIVSRAAKKVVVGDAMGVITVDGSTGVIL